MADPTCTCGRCTFLDGGLWGLYAGNKPIAAGVKACPWCRDWLNADGTITTAEQSRADHEAMDFLRTHRPELVPLVGGMWRVAGDEITRNSAAQAYAKTAKDPAEAVLKAKEECDRG